MRVREAMTPSPVTVTPRTSVSEARRLLHRHRVRHLPVVEGDRLVGILSDRDVMITDRQLAESLAALQSDLVDGRYRQIHSVMRRALFTVTPDTPVPAAARTLADRRIGALPVVERGRLVGILTATDCLRLLQQREAPAHAPPQSVAFSPMPPGDERPGRMAGRPNALVVSPDPTNRAARAERLAEEGYAVVTCPGPLSATCCPARDGRDALLCSRVPDDLALLVVDQRTARTRLLEAYHAWHPRALLDIDDE